MSVITSDMLDEKIAGRFWSKVSIKDNDACWLWTGSVNKKGYGSFNVTRKFKITKIAHRIAYLLGYKLLDTELLVCHSCDTPGCCNPHHLFQGTAKENSEDMVRKGRSPLGEKQGLTSLTNLDVAAIKACLNSGRFEQKELASKFMVSQQAISRINTKKDWRHI